MGTHAGVRHIQAELRRTQATHFLKTDYSRFFPSIDRARLHRLIERKIKCDKTLATIRAMVPNTGHGLPIGSPDKPVVRQRLWRRDRPLHSL